MNDTADRLQALYDSTPDARLVLVEGELVLDVPESPATSRRTTSLLLL